MCLLFELKKISFVQQILVHWMMVRMSLFIKWLYFTDKTCSKTGWSHQLLARFCYSVDYLPSGKICCPFLHKACRSSLFCNAHVYPSTV